MDATVEAFRFYSRNENKDMRLSTVLYLYVNRHKGIDAVIILIHYVILDDGSLTDQLGNLLRPEVVDI